MQEVLKRLEQRAADGRPVTVALVGAGRSRSLWWAPAGSARR